MGERLQNHQAGSIVPGDMARPNGRTSASAEDMTDTIGSRLAQQAQARLLRRGVRSNTVEHIWLSLWITWCRPATDPRSTRWQQNYMAKNITRLC